MSITVKPFHSLTNSSGQHSIRLAPVLGMYHTGKSKAWAVWCGQAWKALNRIAEKVVTKKNS
jgi:hypothetical protein